MKKNKLKILALLSSLTIFSTVLLSCASTKVDTPVLVESVDDFTTKTLSNGITVTFKQNRGSKIIVLRMIIEGGTSALDETLGGLEDITFDLLLRGSESYPYEKIKQLEYEKSFSLSSSVGKDYSALGFTCIQRDMSEVFELFSDCVLNPRFLEADFNQLMTENSAAMKERSSSPNGALSLALTKTAFQGHPYATTTKITEETYKNINLDLIRSHHQSLLNALRLKFVIVGNFSQALQNDFVSKLEIAFGNLSKKQYSEPKIPKIPFSLNGNVKIANEQAGNTGYVAGFFPCPSRSDTDYIPFAIATMYLDDLFFSNVREKAGAVYSINTGVIGGKELLGVISAYKVSDQKNLKNAIMQAFASYSDSELEKDIDQYKNKYISALFSPSQTASGSASNVVSSLEFFGDARAYLKRVEAVQNTTSKQVQDAFKKYLEPIAKENYIRWIVVDGDRNLDDYGF
ncbi:MAG: insulinase family protein [Treponema sp.]|nr:insulinase family protein [Treponema sp.]